MLIGYLLAVMSRGLSVALSCVLLVASSPVLSVTPLPVPSCGQSATPLPVLSCGQSATPLPVLSHGQSAALLPVPFSVPSTGNPLFIPEELSQTGSRSDGDSNIAERENELETLGRGSDSEEEDMDDFLDTSGAEPRAKEMIRDWNKLREQLKSELIMAHK
jgi:hypothetical protein